MKFALPAAVVAVSLTLGRVMMVRRRRARRELARLEELLLALRADMWRELDRIEDEIP